MLSTFGQTLSASCVLPWGNIAALDPAANHTVDPAWKSPRNYRNHVNRQYNVELFGRCLCSIVQWHPRLDCSDISFPLLPPSRRTPSVSILCYITSVVSQCNISSHCSGCTARQIPRICITITRICPQTLRYICPGRKLHSRTALTKIPSPHSPHPVHLPVPSHRGSCYHFCACHLDPKRLTGSPTLSSTKHWEREALVECI